MANHRSGTFRLFRVFGIDVLLHWSWFLVALIQARFTDLFNGVYWHVATYLALFGIVLLHEFGHVLACRTRDQLEETADLATDARTVRSFSPPMTVSRPGRTDR